MDNAGKIKGNDGITALSPKEKWDANSEATGISSNQIPISSNSTYDVGTIAWNSLVYLYLFGDGQLGKVRNYDVEIGKGIR
jgi:hypothetical protein